MKKTLTKANTKKTSKKKSPAKRRYGFSTSSTDRGIKIIKYITKENGELETKEERKQRLAEREALTLRAFQMAYDNYHRRRHEN